MKVVFSIWILAVLIQEVIPSTLVRLPRHTDKNHTLVHTEYEAKYEQKGKHGNESYSSVSGKQQIVHDHCTENWNSFAEKCASLIKDLVASLANVVTSKPGDATNLHLHIKNTFRHFDNSHNCTYLNHTAKTLSDLNLSPLFKNITVNTVGSNSKTDVANGSGAKHKKCGGKDAPCDEGKDSDTTKDKSIVLVSNGEEGDGKAFDQNHSKDNNQPSGELYYEYNNRAPTGNVGALVDAEDMKPENSESSNDQLTNNSRRQIKYPEHLVKPHKISVNSDNNPVADPKHSYSNQKHPEGVRYPFLVTVKPNPQSAKSSESPSVVLYHPSLSGTSSESDVPKSLEYEPSQVSLPQENSSESTFVLPKSSSGKSNGMPSSASYLLTSPNNENSSPNNIYLRPAPQVMSEPHSSSNNEDDPKVEVLSSNDSGLNQKSINPTTNKKNQSPVIIYEKPYTADYNPDQAVLVPRKSVSNKPFEQSSGSHSENQVIYNGEAEKSMTDDHALNPVIIPVERHDSDQKLQSSAMLLEEPVTDCSNGKSDGQPIAILSEPQLLEDSSTAGVALPVKSASSELNAPSSVNLSEESVTGSHISQSEVISAEQIESGPDAISSSTAKSIQQPTIYFPETHKTEDQTSDLSHMVPDNHNSNVNSLTAIPAVLVENEQTVAVSEECKTTESESFVTEAPVLIHNKKSSEGSAKEWLLFTTPIMYDWDKTSNQGNTKLTVNQPQDHNSHNEHSSGILVTDSNKNLPQTSESESDIETLNPHPIYKPEYNSAILSPEDMLPIVDNGKPLIEESATTECHQTTGDGSYHTISMTKPISSVPEVANQQSEISVPIEKQKTDSNIPNHSSLTAPESFEPQYSDKETVNNPVGTLYYPQQSVQNEKYTTPLPFYPVKTVTVIPASIQQLHSEPEDSEMHESQGKDFTVTKDEHGPSVVIVGDNQIEEQVNVPTVDSKTEGATPFIVYPVKSLPTSTQSPDCSGEKSNQETDQPVLVNSGFSDDNHESESQSHVEPLEAKSMTHEQQNSNGDSSIQPLVATESSLTHDSSNEHEHPVIYAPVGESDNVQNPQVIVKPDKILSQSTQTNDHPQNSVHLNSVPSSTSDSETIPVIYSEPEPETAIKQTPLKPAQPGVLVQNTEDHPQQGEEHNTLLIEPTTYQTTSEEPTPSQVNVPGLLTHTTSIPQDSDETIMVRPSTSPKSTSTYEHDDDDDDEEDCCSCESCTEEEISDPKQYKETACKNLEEARKELKAIFDKIKKKLKCGRKAPQTITSS